MKIYILANAGDSDRDVLMKSFKTLEEAQDQMKKEYDDAKEDCESMGETADNGNYIDEMNAYQSYDGSATWWSIQEFDI